MCTAATWRMEQNLTQRLITHKERDCVVNSELIKLYVDSIGQSHIRKGRGAGQLLINN